MNADKKSTILFVTTANLVSNPRLQKELQLSIQAGYQPIVMAIHSGDWSTRLEKETLQSYPDLTIYYADATRHHFFSWLLVSMINQLLLKCKWIHFSVPALQAFAINKRSLLLFRKLQKSFISADMVVAHNLGAFYPAYFYACKHNIPLGVDIEDYHPGEAANQSVKELVLSHLAKILPAASYISYAAPLIKDKAMAVFHLPNTASHLVINNVFSENEFVQNSLAQKDDLLKLVWFSQNIDFNRGLEKILPVLDGFASEIELTLIGNLRSGFNHQQINHRKYIRVKEPLPQKMLHLSLDHYDIGLALEDGTEDENRNICLTNKIWAYVQAGLYIIASGTPAQVQFAAGYPDQVMVLPNDESGYKQIIGSLILQKKQIRIGKPGRFTAAKAISWEQESEKLLTIWAALIGHPVPIIN